MKGESAKRRKATGTASGDRQALSVDPTFANQETRGCEAIFDIDDAPISFQSVTKFTAVARRSPVVHVDHGKTPTRPVLGPIIQRETRLGGGPAMALDEQGRF